MKPGVSEQIQDVALDEVKLEILAKMAYFGIFKYPLKSCEISNLMVLSCPKLQLQKLLDWAVKEGACYTYKGFYAMDSSVKTWVNHRSHHEKVGAVFFKRLPRYVRLISTFPFVKAIAISGSLSKGVIHDKGDVDYFIITQVGRLWLSKGLLSLFKKVFLLNSKKYFCVNYLIDEESLLLEDQNRFTATEIVYLIPVYNKALIDRFKAVNDWTDNFYPHFIHPITMELEVEKTGVIKEGLERLLSGTFGTRLDAFFRRTIVKRWKKKFKNFDAEKFELALRSRKGISKHHPQDFQTVVLQKLETEMKRLREKLKMET